MLFITVRGGRGESVNCIFTWSRHVPEWLVRSPGNCVGRSPGCPAHWDSHTVTTICRVTSYARYESKRNNNMKSWIFWIFSSVSIYFVCLLRPTFPLPTPRRHLPASSWTSAEALRIPESSKLTCPKPPTPALSTTHSITNKLGNKNSIEGLLTVSQGPWGIVSISMF